MTYETEATMGSMLIANENHKNIQRTLSLKKPVPLSEHRAVRKLLQMAAAGDNLICNGSEITGFGRICGNYNQADADLFEIRFTRHYCWQLLHGGHELMAVHYGQPALPLPPPGYGKAWK